MTSNADGPRFTVADDRDHSRFTLSRDGEVVGFADYHERDGALVIPHVETLVQHRGQGYAGRLMEGLLGIVRQRGQLVVPVCPFAAAHIRDDARHHDLLA